MADPFLTAQIRDYYPQEYWRIHNRASAKDTFENLKRYAKQSGIKCFNYMDKTELVAAINRVQSGETASHLEEAARKRFYDSKLAEALR